MNAAATVVFGVALTLAPSSDEPAGGDAPRGETSAGNDPRGSSSTGEAAPAAPAAPAEPLGGGYWGPLGKPPPAPPDGAWQRTTGTIILPLGLLRVGAGVLSIYASQSPRCEAWLDGDPTTCRGLRSYGYWGIAFGGLMAVTGATLLGLGVVQGRRYETWRQQWALGGSLSPEGVHLRLALRF